MPDVGARQINRRSANHVQSPLLTEKDGKVSCEITQLDEERPPEGDVIVVVQYSTLNDRTVCS